MSDQIMTPICLDCQRILKPFGEESYICQDCKKIFNAHYLRQYQSLNAPSQNAIDEAYLKGYIDGHVHLANKIMYAAQENKLSAANVSIIIGESFNAAKQNHHQGDE